MTFAVHSIHVSAVEIDERGRYSLNKRDWVQLGAAMATFETLEEAEQWRAEWKPPVVGDRG